MKRLFRQSIAGLAGCLWGMMAGCSLESPKAPNWNTIINIPVTDHTYSLLDIVAEEENFRTGADSILTFHFEQVLDTTHVGDHLTLPDIHERLTFGLETFVIPSVPVMADRFFWSQLTPEVITLNGATGAVSAFSFNSVPSAVHSSEDLLYAVLVSGYARLHIYNRLAVDLEDVSLTMQDSATSRTVVSSPKLSRIAARDSMIVDVEMRGNAIPRQASWLISGRSPGSKGELIRVDSMLPIDVVVEMRDFVISAAQARFPAINLQSADTVWLEEENGNAFDHAAFKNGRLILQMDNRSSFASPDLVLEFPQIENPVTRKTLALYLGLRPNAITQTEINLAGWTATLPLPPVGSPQAIQVVMRATTDDLRSSFVEVGESTQMIVTVDMENLQLDHFSGRLAPREINLDSTIRAVDLANDWGDWEGLTLQEANLQVEILTTLNLPLTFSGALYGFRNGQAGIPFPLDISVPAAGSDGGQTYLPPPYTASNSAIIDFINQRPDMIAVAGRVRIGGLDYGSVRREDIVSARFNLDLPLNLRWNARQFEGESEALEITPPDYSGDAMEEKDGKVILSGDATRRLRSGELKMELENFLPVAGEVTFFFSADSSRLFTRPDLVLGPVAVDAAMTDAAGKAKGAILKQATIALDSTDVLLFQNRGQSNKKLWFSHRVAIAGSGGRNIRFSVADYIRVKALIALVLNVGE